MMRPRLPCNSPAIGWLRLQPFEHERGVGASEAEAVRQDASERHVVLARAHDRHVGERRSPLLDVAALAYEAVVHHQKRIDRLLHPGGAERMASERLGGGDWRALVAEYPAQRPDFLQIDDR